MFSFSTILSLPVIILFANSSGKNLTQMTEISINGRERVKTIVFRCKKKALVQSDSTINNILC